MRDMSVRHRADMNKNLQSLCKMMDDCPCVEYSDVEDKVAANVSIDNREKALATAATVSATAAVLNDTMNTTVTMPTLAKMIFPGHDHKLNDDTAHVDVHDHKYVHACDVPVVQKTDTHPDREIENECKDGEEEAKLAIEEQTWAIDENRKTSEKCDGLKTSSTISATMLTFAGTSFPEHQHEHHDEIVHVDVDDHEYVHACDVPIVHKTKTHSDCENQIHYKNVQEEAFKDENWAVDEKMERSEKFDELKMTATTPITMPRLAGIIFSEHDHEQHDEKDHVDVDDHEYVHACDVPKTKTLSECGIQISYKDMQDEENFEAREDIRAADKNKKSSKKCEKCKRYAEVARCLEAEVVDLNESVRAMNDYIVECAQQMACLERKKKRGWKKHAVKSGTVGRDELR